ncbi:PGA12 Phosphomutase-like protein 3 [Candida maltosa Xu316]|uniref:Phosphomutase, putative n=1 Tax=Candida maltosa (strain Xu316) TaxID=1245528 RepID=M3K1R2_CANMX|nr:Phosphomutase, putative [Candida maltosa Xu316]
MAITRIMLLQLFLTATTFAQVILASSDPTFTLPKFTSSDKYFGQSDPDIKVDKVNVTDNFGLESKFTWKDVIDSLSDKEKLFFIQRHGEGWHNVAPSNFSSDDWNCYWMEQPGRDGVIWEDAELTPNGIQQIENLAKQVNDTENLPWPEKFYVSPLRRTLQTWELTWKVLNEEKNVDQAPLVKEFARETYGIDSESKRHNKTYITENYPFATFEANFTELDELWKPDARERSQHRKYRAAQLLSDIFDDAGDAKVISIVTHSGLIGSLLDVVGHRSYPMATGSLIPVIIHRKPKKTKTYTMDKPDKTYSDVCPNPPSSISGAPSDYTTIAE